MNEDPGELIFFQTEDGQSRIDVRLIDETVWLSQKLLAELFQKDVRTIGEHIRNIFEEGELKSSDSVIRKFRTTAADGKSYQVEHYSLDVIISVGYRVKSHRGVQFRVWATQQLRDYLVKGFVLNDEKFKQGKASNYFEQLLARIRDIRSSEKEFWRKVLEIYATSIDYNPRAEPSQEFFATVQNKMHWAIHGHTAAELIAERAKSTKHNMGLTVWPKGQVAPRKADVAIAKNYLNAEELYQLNLIVAAYLDFAALQATNQRPMYMRDWIQKLDQFIQLSEREILTHAGKISAEAARAFAEQQYEVYHRGFDAQLSPVELHFDEAVKKAKRMAQPKKWSGKTSERVQ